MRILNTEAKTIAFSGYDGITEIRFALPLDVLAGMTGDSAPSPAAALKAFDSLRDRIQTVAASTHARGRKTFHMLEMSRF
jgi:hypothetical protein